MCSSGNVVYHQRPIYVCQVRESSINTTIDYTFRSLKLSSEKTSNCLESRYAIQSVLLSRSDDLVEILMLGTSLGFLQLYTATGVLMHRQRVHNTSITNITLRARHQGLDSDDTSEEIAIGFQGGLARGHTLEVTFRKLLKWALPKLAGEYSQNYDITEGSHFLSKAL